MLAEKLAKFRAKPDTINTKDKDRNRKAPKFKDSYRNSASLCRKDATLRAALAMQIEFSLCFSSSKPSTRQSRILKNDV
jgi:hypothetical protein